MSDESPKKLDNLFRQGSERYDFEYNAEAWAAMETLLDKDARRRFFWWWLGGFGILLLAGFVLFLGNDQAGSIAADQEQDIIENSKPNEKGTLKTDIENKGETYIPENKNEIFAEQKTNGENNLSNKKELPLNSNNIKNQPQKNNIPNGHFPKGEKNNAEKTTPQPTNNTPVKNIKKEIYADIKTGQTISQNNAAPDTFSIFEKNKTAHKTNLNKIPFLPLAIIKYNPKNGLPPYPPTIKENANKDKKDSPKDNSKKQAWIFGLTAATETTSVGTADYSDFSWKLGGHIEYRFLNKYSASLGANYIRKKYDVGAGEYIPPKGFWTNGIAPVSTDARCNVLELPLLLSYYPKGYSNPGFFGNIGMVSYLMLRERYTYTYADPAPDSIIAWGTDNEYQTWFGIAQIAFGYNHILSEKTSLQYLPYLQIPLAGVGHGNVKLWSIGMSMKFNFKVK
ncbi:MAG TPA: hypothetical protein ENJ95_09655 [Bacteroidetes bacterium]|nr:hypothetical protein [Bacteroidota bacterium]